MPFEVFLAYHFILRQRSASAISITARATSLHFLSRKIMYAHSSLITISLRSYMVVSKNLPYLHYWDWCLGQTILPLYRFMVYWSDDLPQASQNNIFLSVLRCFQGGNGASESVWLHSTIALHVTMQFRLSHNYKVDVAPHHLVVHAGITLAPCYLDWEVQVN